MDLTKENKLSTSFANAPRVVTQKIEEPTKRRPRQGYKIRQVASGLPPASVDYSQVAVVVDKLPELDLAEYIISVTKKLTTGGKVDYADELEPSNVCLFLSDAKQAKSQHGQCVQVGEHSLLMRPLPETPLVRVLATNVMPFVSNDQIAKLLLDDYGIEVKNSVYLEAYKDPNNHSVVSFARHLYVEPRVIRKFPARITGLMDEWPCTIYFGSEEHWCDSCQRVGHFKSSCAHKNIQSARIIGAPPASNNGTDPPPSKNNGPDPPSTNNNGPDPPSTNNNGPDPPSTNNNGPDPPSTNNNGPDPPSTNNNGPDPPSTNNNGTDPPPTPTQAIGAVPHVFVTPSRQITHNVPDAVFLTPINLNLLPLASRKESSPSVTKKTKNTHRKIAPAKPPRSRPSSRDTSPRLFAALEQKSTTPRTSPYASYANSAPQGLSSPSNAAHVAGPSRTETSPPMNPGIKLIEFGSPLDLQQYSTFGQPPTTPPGHSPRSSGSFGQPAPASGQVLTNQPPAYIHMPTNASSSENCRTCGKGFDYCQCRRDE